MKHEYKYQLYILKVYRMSTSQIRVKIICNHMLASLEGWRQGGHLPTFDLKISQLMMKKHNNIVLIPSIIIVLI